jgi:hypothetical protein
MIDVMIEHRIGDYRDGGLKKGQLFVTSFIDCVWREHRHGHLLTKTARPQGLMFFADLTQNKGLTSLPYVYIYVCLSSGCSIRLCRNNDNDGEQHQVLFARSGRTSGLNMFSQLASSHVSISISGTRNQALQLTCRGICRGT